MRVREEQLADTAQVRAVECAAFGREDEAAIAERLQADGDCVLSLVAERDGSIIGHAVFYRVWIGETAAAGLGPMAVAPEVQRTGAGGAMIRAGLEILRTRGEPMVVVLGHPDYYPRFGFSAQIAEAFEAPWSGPAFMAIRLSDAAPASGTVRFPRVFEGH